MPDCSLPTVLGKTEGTGGATTTALGQLTSLRTVTSPLSTTK